MTDSSVVTFCIPPAHEHPLRLGMAGTLLVVLRAEQGVGKTIAAPLVAKATGCERIYADEPDRRAVDLDLYEGRRVLVCSNDDYQPSDDAAPVLRISIEGDRPRDTLRSLLTAFGQSVEALSVMNTPSLSA